MSTKTSFIMFLSIIFVCCIGVISLYQLKFCDSRLNNEQKIESIFYAIEAEGNAMIRIYPIHCIENIDYFVIVDNYTVIHMTGDLNTDFYRTDFRSYPVLSSIETVETYLPKKEEIKKIDEFISEIKENSGDNWRVGDGSPIRLYLNGEYFGAHRYNDPAYELYNYLHMLFGIDMKEYNYA